jgi:hypothetical protein
MIVACIYRCLVGLSLGAQRSTLPVGWGSTYIQLGDGTIRSSETPLFKMWILAPAFMYYYLPTCNSTHFSLFSFYNIMVGWFTLGKKGLTPGSASQNATSAEQTTSPAATHLSNVDSNNVAPASPDQQPRSIESGVVRDLQCEVKANELLAFAEGKMWIEGRPGQGVFVKKHKGSYAYSPVGNDNTGLHEAVVSLNVRVCLLIVSILQ